MTDPLHIAVTVDVPALGRLAAAIERIADTFCRPDAPPLTRAGPLILVPNGQPLETSMSSIPLGKDGVQRLNAGNYDRAVQWSVASGSATVSPETPDGLSARIVLADDATDGGSVEIEATADVRHGEDVVNSTASFLYNIVAADAPALTGAGFEVVDKAEAPPAPGPTDGGDTGTDPAPAA
jgi:hypothetical protein